MVNVSMTANDGAINASPMIEGIAAPAIETPLWAKSPTGQINHNQANNSQPFPETGVILAEKFAHQRTRTTTA